MVVEGARRQSCATLFRELKRLCPSAVLDSYHFGPQAGWKREYLEIDLDLIRAHRKEAGAPEPPTVQEQPELQKLQLPPDGPGDDARGLGAPGAPRPASGAAPRVAEQPAAARGGPPGPSGAGGGREASDVVAPPRRTRQEAIRDFIGRWRLDERSTSSQLERLTAGQLMWLNKNFKLDPDSRVAPSRQLQLAIRDLEERSRPPPPSPREPREPERREPPPTRPRAPPPQDYDRPAAKRPAEAPPEGERQLLRPKAAPPRPSQAPTASSAPALRPKSGGAPTQPREEAPRPMPARSKDPPRAPPSSSSAGDSFKPGDLISSLLNL